MSNTLTVRLPEDLAEWLRKTSKQTGIPAGQIVREQLEKVRKNQGDKPFLRLAGIIDGTPADVSLRKGFSSK